MPKKKKRFVRKPKRLSDEDKIDLKLIKKEKQIEDSIIRKVRGFFNLHIDNYESTYGRRIETTLFLLNFFAIVLFVIDTHNPTGIFKSILTTTEFVVVGIFAVEYIVRMWVAGNKIKHFFSFYAIIDLLSILPIAVHFANLGFLRVFRILRLFRLIRVLRFQRMFKQKNTMFGQLTDTQLIIIRLLLGVFTIVFVSSGLIWSVENKVNPGELGTIWDALYFSIVTLSTVGYGDVTPLSPIGKAITVAMILSGIALIPWQLGKLVKVLFSSAKKTHVTCQRCGLADHDADSLFCKICGKKLMKPKKNKREKPDY